jgi:hypothetical protein
MKFLIIKKFLIFIVMKIHMKLHMKITVTIQQII